MSPDKARALRAGLTSAPWAADGLAVTDSTHGLLFWPEHGAIKSDPGVAEVVAATPALLDAYLAEHDRAEGAEAARKGAVALFREMLRIDMRHLTNLAALVGRTLEDGWAATIHGLHDLKAERNRLARILAVECGDEFQAPEGWEADGGMWVRRVESGHVVACLVRRSPRSWSWIVFADQVIGYRDLALEAMEAADKHAGVTHG